MSFAQNDDIIVDIPESFSPNSLENNIFKIKSANVSYIVVHFKVFDRWGNEMYASKSNDAAWDGTKNGESIPDGTYFYSIKLKLDNKKKEEFTGFVNLIR